MPILKIIFRRIVWEQKKIILMGMVKVVDMIQIMERSEGITS